MADNVAVVMPDNRENVRERFPPLAAWNDMVRSWCRREDIELADARLHAEHGPLVPANPLAILTYFERKTPAYRRERAALYADHEVVVEPWAFALKIDERSHSYAATLCNAVLNIGDRLPLDARSPIGVFKQRMAHVDMATRMREYKSDLIRGQLSDTHDRFFRDAGPTRTSDVHGSAFIVRNGHLFELDCLAPHVLIDHAVCADDEFVQRVDALARGFRTAAFWPRLFALALRRTEPDAAAAAAAPAQ